MTRKPGPNDAYLWANLIDPLRAGGVADPLMGGGVKPADLRVGDQLGHRVPRMSGALTVVATVADILGDEFDRVYVDVEVNDRSLAWDPVDLPAGTGAETFQWLGVAPLRYRLTFRPGADVEVAAP